MRTLDEVVKAVIVEEGGDSMANYDRYMILAGEAVMDLNIDLLAQLKTVMLDINDNYTVDLPSDMVSLSKVGLIFENTIHKLWPDNTILLHYDLNSCGVPIANPNPSDANDVVDGVAPFYFYNWQGNDGQYYNFYGLDGTNVYGTYRHDITNNQLCLSLINPGVDQVCMEYRASGLGDKNSWLVPDISYECLKGWIHWRKIKDRKGWSIGEKAYAERFYYNQRRILRRRKFGLSVEELNAALARSYGQAAKTP